MTRAKITPELHHQPNRRGVGRPSRAQQLQRNEELLNAALDIFLEQGFEQTKVDDIAKCVGMSKQTVYAHFDDKAALFKAAVQRAIDRYAMSPETIEAAITDDLVESLTALARLRIANATTPNSVKLQRILVGQAHRFPELNQAATTKGAGPIINALIALFERHSARGDIADFEPDRLALAFLDLVVVRPARNVVLGNTPGKDEIERQVQFAIAIFLHGIQKR